MTLTPGDRALLMDMQRDLAKREMAYDTARRRFTASLAWFTAGLSVVVALLPWVAIHVRPDLVALVHGLVERAGETQVNGDGTGLHRLGGREVAGVELWGVLGALVSGIVALRRMRPRLDGLALPFAQLFIKLPAGSLTAVFAIVLIQADIVPFLRPLEPARVGASAVLFGYAQEALTRLIDRQAASLLNKSADL